jgi:hypothetical protein
LATFFAAFLAVLAAFFVPFLAAFLAGIVHHSISIVKRLV